MRRTGPTLLVISLLLAVGCGSSDEPPSKLSGLDPDNKVDFQTARDKSIMGMSEQQVRANIGNPKSKESQEVDGVEEVVLVYSTNSEGTYLRVVLEDDQVRLFEMSFD